MLRQLALIVHLLGVVLWVGGMIAAAHSASQLAGAPPGERKAGLAAVRSALSFVATPGIALAWLGGLAILVPGFFELYARAGWMHGKLTIAIVLSALHGALVARVRRAAGGEIEPRAGFFSGVAVAIGVLAFVVVSLVILRPGA